MPHIFKMFLSFEINLKERPCLVIFIPSLYINGYLPEAKCCCHLPEVKSGDTRGRAEAVQRFVLPPFPYSCTGGNSWEIGTQEKLGPPLLLLIPFPFSLKTSHYLLPQNENRRRRVLVRGGRCIFLGLHSVWFVWYRLQGTILNFWEIVICSLTRLYACQSVQSVMISKFPRCPK